MDLLKKKWGLAILLAALVLISCEKEEKPYPKAPEGLLTAGMGSDYRSSLYFDLNSGAFSQTSDRDLFSLSFSSDENDTAIYLNSFNFMFAKSTGDTSFRSVVDTIGGIKWHYDYPDGDSRRTALKSMIDKEGVVSREVFVLDMGYDADLNRLPFWKVQLHSYDANGYRIRFAKLDGSKETWARIERKDGYRRVMFDFLSKQQIQFEPESTNWHLCFSQYTDFDLTTEGDTLAYLVRGVLFDNERMSAVLVDSLSWEEIDISMAVQLTKRKDENTIGYDWKRYDFDLARYLIEPDRIYVLDAGLAGYFKLRFLDYYNDAGERGFASFEITGL
jgi:hypothetical protein